MYQKVKDIFDVACREQAASIKSYFLKYDNCWVNS